MNNSFSDILDFIREQYNSEKGFIPLHAPCFGGNEKKYLNNCIDSTFVSSVGEFVDRFELMLEKYTGAQKVVMCVNGTNALHLALQLVGVKQGDEVLTQALTFIATANAISYCGAHPVFLDVDKETMGLSPGAVRKWLENNAEVKGMEVYNKTTGRRIKACVPMHTFGHPVKLSELQDVCNDYFLELIEDAAESLGSFYKGQHTGTFGKIGVLSFNGNKTITTGGGGALLFNDKDLAEQAKHLTTQAKVPHAWEFVHDSIGYNYRMPNINAALGCAQMEELPSFISVKRKRAENYSNFFTKCGLNFFREPEFCCSNYWLNVLILGNINERNSFLDFSNSNGVMTRPIWRLMSKLPMFEHCQTDELSNSVWLEERVVNIPSGVK